ncbi:hypothetical protein AGOR_G00154240 [Albula goreensis]|uniref:Migration and invasion-inhibitory protein n=1 Tax=Albula goreensis TaxID=1534307 RepID=A0A8T3D3F8_9TELE|nr:hypothetical protein AGOR_G00154240 [Albula goreensis]
MTERSEQFFTELRNFRKVNREECIHSQIPGAGKDDFSPLKCTFCYRINSRLFPSPLDPQTACPVCKVPKSHYPNSETAFIRVSIPRSTLLPAHRYKAHRRRSFNPSDSLSLPSHCMTGWSSTAPAEAPQLSSLDLRSCLTTTHTTSGPAAQPDTNLMQQSTAKPKKQLDVISGVAVSQRSEELIDASRLARYRFQRLTPNQIKPHSTAYPIF